MTLNRWYSKLHGLFIHGSVDRKTPGKSQIAFWMLATLVAVGIALKNFDTFQLGTYRDDAIYTIIARSILSGGPYGMINLPVVSSTPPFPFGFPLFLVPALAIAPQSQDILKIIPFLATLLNGALLFWGWRWLSRGKSYWWGAALSALYLSSSLVLAHTHMVMSEPLFATFCLLAMILTEQAVSHQESRLWVVWMSLALTFVIFTRVIGIVLVGSIFVYLWITRGKPFWKPFLSILVGMALVLSLVVALTPVTLASLFPSRYLSSGESYLFVHVDTPKEEPVVNEPVNTTPPSLLSKYIPPTIIYAFKQHFGIDFRKAVFPVGGGSNELAFGKRLGIPNLPLLLGFIVSILIFTGFVYSLWNEGVTIFIFFGVSYLAAISIWVWEGPRLLYPVLPQLQYGLLIGASVIATWIASLFSRSFAQTIKQGALILGILVLIAAGIIDAWPRDDSLTHVGNLADRTSWIDGNTSITDVVMTESPEVDYLYSGRKTVPYPDLVNDPAFLVSYLETFGVKYILVAPQIFWHENDSKPFYSWTTNQLLPTLGQLVSQKQLNVVYNSPTDMLEVFELLP